MALISKFRWLAAGQSDAPSTGSYQGNIKNGERILGDKEFIQFELDLESVLKRLPNPMVDSNSIESYNLMGVPNS